VCRNFFLHKTTCCSRGKRAENHFFEGLNGKHLSFTFIVRAGTLASIIPLASGDSTIIKNAFFKKEMLPLNAFLTQIYTNLSKQRKLWLKLHIPSKFYRPPCRLIDWQVNSLLAACFETKHIALFPPLLQFVLHS
jgi:hypothetical protein